MFNDNVENFKVRVVAIRVDNNIINTPICIATLFVCKYLVRVLFNISVCYLGGEGITHTTNYLFVCVFHLRGISTCMFIRQ